MHSFITMHLLCLTLLVFLIFNYNYKTKCKTKPLRGKNFGRNSAI